MTEVMTFLFQQIKRMYEFGNSFTFEFFGQRVSVFSLIAGFSIIYMLIRFLQLFVPTETNGLGRIGMGRNENRMDKLQERRELSALRNGARHVNYSGSRHTKRYRNANREFLTNREILRGRTNAKPGSEKLPRYKEDYVPRHAKRGEE